MGKYADHRESCGECNDFELCQEGEELAHEEYLRDQELRRRLQRCYACMTKKEKLAWEGLLNNGNVDELKEYLFLMSKKYLNMN